MNPELQKQLLDMLKGLTSIATNGAGWIAGQVPPLVQEKIRLGRVEETAWMLIFGAWAGLLLYMTYRLWVWACRIVKEDDDNVPAFFLPVVTGVIGILPFSIQLHSTLLVWFAPRLYIIEWLKESVK